MKFLHLSDLHIGKTVNGFPLLDDQRHILQTIRPMAVSHHVDAVVLAGDLYDKTTPSAEAVSVLDGFLTDLADAEIPCFAIPGNHDSAERIAYASALLARQGIFLSPVFDGSMPHVDLFDSHGPCTFWLLPFLKPATVKPFFPEQAESIGQSYTKAIEAVIASSPIDHSARNVLIAHQFVTVGSLAPEQSDSELTLGGIDNVDASVFDEFDYVALGHIHRPQRIGKDTIRYAGSLLKYSFSEIRYPKSAVLVTLAEKGSVELELLPLEPLHDMREIRGPLDALVSTAPEDATAHDYIHAVLTDPHPPIDALTRLRSAYPNVMGIDFEGMGRRTEFAAEQCPKPEALNPFELFESFFIQQSGCELTELQKDIVSDSLSNAIGRNGDTEGTDR